MENVTYKKLSVNPKYNALLESIYNDLMNFYGGNPEESVREIRRYAREFPHEIDYNIAQYGNVLVYYKQVRDRFLECGYSPRTVDRMSNDRIWRIYRSNVGYVVRQLFLR